MKFIISMLFFLICLSCRAEDAFFDTESAWKKSNDSVLKENTNTVIKSMNSNICHSSTSPYKGRVNIVRKNSDVNGDAINVYKNISECIADGGKPNKHEIAVLEKEDPEAAYEKKEEVLKGEQDVQYAGFNWGAGLMFAHYSKDIVLDASIENGVVNVNHDIKNKAIAMVETHFFWTPGSKKILGIGPFIGVGLAGEGGVDPLSIYGGGLMLGFRKPNTVTSWNMGIGFFVDTDAKLLKSGIKNGDATAEADSAKLFKKDDISGLMIMFSSTF